MKAREISDHKEFSSLEIPWNSCLEEGPCNSVFLRHEWFALYLKHINEHRATNILVVEEDSEIVGFFPGCYRRERIHRLQWPSVGFLSNFYSPLSAIISRRSDGNIEEEIFSYLLRSTSNEWNVLLLRDLPHETGCLERTLTAFDKLGIPFCTYSTTPNWYLPSQGMNYQTYLSSMGKSRKKKLLYERRRLEKTDGYTCNLLCRSSEDLNEAINDYYEVYNKSWKIAEPYPSFHADLMRLAAERGWLRLGVIRIDNQPIAAQLWLVYGQHASIVKVAYDRDFGRLSPGTVLTLILMEHVLDIDKVKEVDFLSGDDPYKKEWMSERRERISLLAYNPITIKGKSLRAFDQHLYPLIQKIRGHK